MKKRLLRIHIPLFIHIPKTQKTIHVKPMVWLLLWVLLLAPLVSRSQNATPILDLNSIIQGINRPLDGDTSDLNDPFNNGWTRNSTEVKVYNNQTLYFDINNPAQQYYAESPTITGMNLGPSSTGAGRLIVGWGWNHSVLTTGATANEDNTASVYFNGVEYARLSTTGTTGDGVVSYLNGARNANGTTDNTYVPSSSYRNWNITSVQIELPKNVSSSGKIRLTFNVDNNGGDDIAVAYIRTHNYVGDGNYNFSTTFTENGSPVALTNANMSITDDDANMSGANITLTNPQTGDALSIPGSLPNGITASFNATNTMVTLSGAASAADYTNAIKQIRFVNNSENPADLQRIINLSVTDASGTTSNTATSSVTVIPVNDPPLGADKTITIVEDDVYTFTAADFSFTDPAENHSFQAVSITTLPTRGTLRLNGTAVTANQEIAVAQIAQLTWSQNMPNENGNAFDSFTFKNIDNGGTANGGQNKAVAANNIIFNVSAMANLSVTQTASNNNPDVGSNVTFTITASNSGPSNATNVVVNDLLANGYTFVSASAAAGTTYNNSSGEWNIGNLADGASKTLTITATVKATGNYSNTASIKASQTDPDNSNNSATITPVPLAVADVAVNKAVSNNSPAVGSNITFTVTANNAGPSNATNITVNDQLPNGYTLVSASASNGTTYNSNSGVWTIGNLNNGASAVLTITATVKASGNYSNTANISTGGGQKDPDNGNNTSTVTPSPKPVADLSVSKTASNNSPDVGSNITFTITANNAGPSNATNVEVSDMLPDGYTFVSASAPSGTTYNNTTGVWALGNLNEGVSAVLTLTATVKASGNYTNSASIKASENDPSNSNNSASVTPLPVAVANIGVSKVVDNNTPTVGDNVTFTITANNVGPSNATNVKVTDVLPNGYTFVSASAPAGTSYNNTTGIWNVGNLSNAANTSLSITATVNTSGNYSNTATITANQNDPDNDNNSATVSTSPKPIASVSVTKTVSNSSPNVGGQVTFTITANNAGPSMATNVKVNDALPDGYTFISASAPTGTTYNSTTGEWNIGNLTNGGNAILTLAATVKPEGNYTNQATITASQDDPDTDNNTANVTPTPKASSDVSITKTINNNNPNAGSDVTFTVTATNNGPSNATNVEVTDLLPSGYTFVSASAPAATTYNSTTGLWTIGNMANGANAVLSITAKVNANGDYNNRASITAAETDPNTNNNSATASASPTAIADLSLTKTVNNTSPDVGSNVNFTVTATNNGPSNASNVQVSDLLPNGYTFVSASPSGTTNYNSVSGLWYIGNLSNSATATLNITATVNASGNYTNTASITANQNDSVSANNSASASTTPTAVADLSLSKTTNNSSPNVGSNVTFTITASNMGPSVATNIEIEDLLPNGYTFVSANTSGNTSYNATTGLWTIANLANGADAILNITAAVNANGNYTNTASVTKADQKDGNSANNSASATSFPSPVANMSVSKTSNNSNPTAGSNITFTITASNIGPSNATGVEVQDLLPNGYTFVSASAPAGTSYNSTTGLWSIGNMANGANSVLTITATVNASGNYANNASIKASETDPDTSNNLATATPFPTASANVSVTKTVSNSSPNVGSNITFAVTASNNGPSGATNVRITDQLPSGYTFVSASTPAGTTYDEGTGLWSIGSLANGASALLNINATVNANGNRTNTATIVANESDPDRTNNTASVTTTPKPITNLAVNKTVNNNTPNVGSKITFTITASNAGPSNATNVEVTDLLPDGYAFVSATPAGGTNYNITTGLWTIGNLAANTNASLAIVTKVNASGNYTNSASIKGSEADADAGNNTATVSTTPVANTDLSVAKTISNNTPNVGSNVTFTITAANAGPSNATNVSVADMVPSGYTFVSASAPAGTTYNPTSGVWTIGDMANQTNRALSITATVNASGNYSNTASISGNENDPENSNNSATATATPVPITNLSVVKTSSNNNPEVGTTVTFTITVSNNGPSNATNVVAHDALPNGYTFVSASAPTGTTYEHTTGEWLIGELANGASSVLTINATVNTSGNYTNTATVNGNENDPDKTNNSSSVSPSSTAVADVSVTKTVSNGMPDVGSSVTFIISANNAGPSNATNVKISDALPSGYEFISATPAGSTTYDQNTGIWNIGSLMAGSNINLSIVAQIKADGNYTNSASVSSASERDPNNANNTAVATTTPVAVSNLSISKTVNNSNPNVGSNVTFSITANNAGPSNASNVKVVDVLPSGYTFVSASTPAGTTYDASAGNWTIGALNNGAELAMTIIATVNASGNYTNTASITGDQKDQNTANNTASISTAPKPVANVAVTKTADNNSPNVGSNVTFSITASNSGPSTATEVSVNDALPSGYTFVSALAPTGTSYDENTGIWNIGNLNSGDNAVLNITARVNSSGNLTNKASITASENDPDRGNNNASITLSAVAVADVVITKTVDNGTPNVGSNVTFTIRASNMGPSNANNIKVIEALPDGYTFVSANAANTTSYNSATGEWNVGNLNANTSVPLTITAKVNESGNYTNNATVSADEQDPNLSNNSVSVSTTPVATANLSVNKTVNNNTPDVGGQVIFTITAANSGPSQATGVTVNDLLPNGYTFISASAPAGTTYDQNNGVWTIGNMANGTNRILNITATVNANGNYTNTATINGNENDTQTSNNTATVTPSPVPTTDLSVAKTASNNNPNVGSNVVFTITAANAGPSNATNVRVNDPLPNGYTFVSYTAPSGSSYDNTTGEWLIGNLANGTNRVLTITATVNASGNYTNTASISSNENDFNKANNIARVSPKAVAVSDVSVTKTVNNNAPNVGSEVVFTITAANAGPSNATSVRVNDLLPSGYTFITASAPTGTAYDNSTGEWFIGNLANGTNLVLNINAKVNPNGNYSNTATIAAAENDPNNANNSSTVNPAPVAQADLRVIKKSNGMSSNVGDEINFVIAAANVGPSNATNVNVTDVIPDGYTFVSASQPAGTMYDDATGVWQIGSLANGKELELSITVKVNASGNYTNTASISATENDPNASNNTSTVTLMPGAVSDVSLTKTIDQTSPAVGEQITFTLTASNAGPSAATSAVKVNDQLPTGYTFISAMANQGAYNNSTGIWDIGNLATGTNATLEIRASVNASGNYTNSATISANETDPDNNNNTSTVTATPVPIANVSVSKTVSDTNPSVGSAIIFTITAGNAGPSTATNVIVNDLLPSGYTFVSASASAGTAYNSATGQWAVGNLGNGAKAILNVTATVNADGDYTNTATITSNENDPDNSDNTASASTVPRPVADIAITKTASSNTPTVGNNITFTITAKNQGPSMANGVSVTDVLPDGYTFVSASSLAGTNYDSASGQWSIGNLANGAEALLTITAKVNASGNFENTASFNAGSASQIDPNSNNDKATVNLAPVFIADLSVTKSSSKNNPNVGSEVSFTITASNQGPSPASNVKVNEMLPSGYTFVSASPSSGNYNDSNGVWTIGNLASGANEELTVTAKVNASGNYTNTVTINADQNDPENGNNTASITPEPVAIADMAVLKTASPMPNVGDKFDFIIIVTNNGPSEATDVTLTDILPDGYTFVDARHSGGTYYDSTTGLWTIGNMPNKASYILLIGATAKPSGNYSNTATARANEFDPNLSNNSDTASLTPVPSADVTVSKTVNATTPNVGSNAIFTITASNLGPSDASAVEVDDLLPSGYTFVSASSPAGTSYNSSNGVWTVGNLAAGANAALNIEAIVNPNGEYRNVATIKAAENDPDKDNNQTELRPAVVAVADVSVSKTTDTATPNMGTDITFTIVAYNEGPSTATNVKVNDLLPSGYTFVSAAVPNGTNYDSATGVWTIGNMATATTVTMSVSATVNEHGSYSNTAYISAVESDPNERNNTATFTPTPVPVADVSVTKTVNNSSPNVGDIVTFMVVASNAGPNMATNVMVNDKLPNGYRLVSATASTGTNYDTATGIWTIGNLEHGANEVLTVNAQVNANGNYTNTARASANENDPNASNNSATINLTPLPSANVSVSKTVNTLTPEVNNEVTFTLTASNEGPSQATNVSVSDKLPNGYDFISAQPSDGTVYNNDTGLWTIGTLANTARASLTITARVNANGNYTNTANITANETDPELANNTASVTPRPLPMADIAITKTSRTARPNVGEQATFIITVTNNGPSPATAVKVTDKLPSGYTFVSANANYDNETGIWTVADLANGASATLEIVASVNASGNYANIASAIAKENDQDLSNNIALTIPVPNPVPTANIATIKTVDNTMPYVGSEVKFTITVSNSGPSMATNVTVNDLLPNGYTFISATPSGNTAYNSATGVWKIGSLPAGTNVVLTVGAKVNASGNYANTATATAMENDPDTDNNSATVTPIPQSNANISVTKTVDNATPTILDNVTFLITASNAGPGNAANVNVRDKLPDGYTFVSANAPTGTNYNADSGIWTIGNLANNASLTLALTVKVNATGNYNNVATINAATADPDYSDNVATSATTPKSITIQPVANNDSGVLNGNNTLVIRILDNDDHKGIGFDPTSVEIVTPPPYGNVEANADGTLSLSPDETYLGDYVFTYRVRDRLGNYTNIATVTIKGANGPKIPNLFTPNGDGRNDAFEIRGLEAYASNELTIINRWSNEVFRSTNYQNNWTGEGLNEGTYYYLLKVKRNAGDDWTIYKGWLTLVRSFKQ